jgi:hypothetical protein
MLSKHDMGYMYLIPSDLVYGHVQRAIFLRDQERVGTSYTGTHTL